MKGLTRFLYACAFGSLLLSVPAHAAITFTTSTVDNSGTSVGTSPSLAIDIQGHLHFAYIADNDVRYAFWNGSSWATETATVEDPYSLAMALDGAGRVHIVYYALFPVGKLRHVYQNSTGTWNTDTVDATAGTVTTESVAIDGGQGIHVVYYNGSDKFLRYAYSNGGAWTVTTVDSSGDTGTSVSLALDSRGQPHIAYQDTGNSKLSWAERVNGTWVLSDVDTGGVPAYVSAAVNSQGHGRISYLRNNLKFASFDGSVWNLSDITSDVGYRPSLVLDGQDHVHVAYWAVNVPHYDFAYAIYDGVSWSTQTIVADFNSLPEGSLSLDASGLPQIAFNDTLVNDAAIAKGAGGGAAAPMGGSPRGLVQAPSHLSASVLGVSSMTITWTDNASNEMGYRLYVASANGTGFNLQADTVTLNASSTTYTITGLLSNTSYQFYVTAVNDGGVVPSSTSSRFTRTYAPSATSVSSYTTSSIGLDWSPNGNAEPGTSYQLQYSTDNVFTSAVTTTTLISTSAATANNLLPSTTYYFRVRSINGESVASAYDAIVSSATDASTDVTAPRAINDLSVAYTGTGGTLQLTWTAPGDDASTGIMPAGSAYLIQYSTADPAVVNWSTASAQVTVSTFGVTPGTTVSAMVPVPLMLKTYYFRIWANDEKPNYSAPSSTQSAFSVPFTQETVDASASGGGGGSMAIDAQGNLHIAYEDGGSGGVAYRKRTGTTWSSSTLIHTDGRNPQIAVGPDGSVHIVYDDVNASLIKYSHFNGVSWSTSTLEGVGTANTYHSIAVDAAGRVHVAYAANSVPTLKYGIYNGVSWSTSSVLGGVGLYNAIALTPAGLPRIVYQGGYSSFNGSSWTHDATFPSYTDLSLALDGNGDPHVSSFENVFGGLGFMHYLHKTGAGAWVNTQVDPPSGGADGGYGSRSRIALDGNGLPQIVYTDLNNVHLRYAVYDGSAWSMGNVNVPGESIYYAVDGVIDANGDVHTLYNYYLTTSLKAGHWTSAGFAPAMGGNSRSLAQAPTGFSSTGLSLTSARYDWTDNASNELGYRVYGSTTSTGPYSLIAGTTTLGPNSNTYTENSLTAGTTYYRYVAAINAGGAAVSQQISFYLSTPGAPTGFTGTALGVSSITWSWSDGSGETGYRVVASTGGALSGDLAADTTYWIETGLSPNIGYSRQAVAFNNSGPSTTTAVVRYTFPAAPATVASTFLSVNSNTFVIAWSTNTNPVAVTSYTVVASTDSSAPHGSAGDVAMSTMPAAAALTASVSGLSSGTTYFVFAAARNVDGVQTSYVLLGSTQTWPGLPSQLQYTAATNASLTLSWVDTLNGSGTRYRVLISTDPNPSSPSAGALVSSSDTYVLSLTTAGLSVNVTYYAQVAALNTWNVVSSYTSSLATSTLANAPITGVFSSGSNNSVTLGWNANSNPTGTLYKADVSTNSFTTLITSSQTPNTSTVFTGLTANTTYQLQVKAFSFGGTPTSLLTGLSTVTLPSPPASSAPTLVVTNSLVANWGSNSNPTGTLFEAQISSDSFATLTTSTQTLYSSATFTGLIANTTYQLQVRAVGWTGSVSAFTTLPSTVTTLLVPGLAGTTFVSVSTDAVQLQWTSGGNGASTVYVAQLSVNSNFSTIDASSSTALLTASFGTGGVGSALLANTTYYARVQATNGGNQSSFVSLTATATYANLPGPLSLVTTSSATIVLAWNANGNPTSGTTYELWRDTDSGYSGPFKTIYSTPAATLSALSSATTYYFKVRTFGMNGAYSAFSTPISTLTFPAPPTAPGSFAASALGVSSITWGWTDVSKEDGYRVLSSTGGVLTTLGSNTTYWIETNLSTNTSYSRQVVAYNTTSNAATSLLARSTLANIPGAPSWMAVYDTSATVQWSAGTNPAGTSFAIGYWITGQSTTTITTTQTSLTLTSLSQGTTYFLSLHAVNGDSLSTAETISISSITGVIPQAVGTVQPSSGTTIVFESPFGQVQVDVPAGCFDDSVQLTVSVPASLPADITGNGLQGAGLGIQIENDHDTLPNRPVTLSLDYPISTIQNAGFDEARLVLAWYNPNNGTWLPLETHVNTQTHHLTANTNHLSIFQIMQAQAATTLSSIRVFPNPLRPARGDTDMRFINLPSQASIRFYTLSGELVQTLYSDNTGMASWDGKNASGRTVGSGVYFVIVEGAGDRQKLRVAVQR